MTKNPKSNKYEKKLLSPKKTHLQSALLVFTILTSVSRTLRSTFFHLENNRTRNESLMQANLENFPLKGFKHRL